MTRTKKALLGIGVTTGAMVIGLFCYDRWQRWEYRRYGGYEAAGIAPIAGAELISYDFQSSDLLPDYSAFWVYKLPRGYYEKLYKDCSAMHFRAGVYIQKGDEGSEYISPGAPSCYMHVELHRESITAQFSGDKLIVMDDYGL